MVYVPHSLIQAGVDASFRLYRRWFPSQPLNELTPLHFHALAAKYKSRDNLGNWITILRFPVCMLAWIGVLYVVGLLSARSVSSGHFFGPSLIAYAIIAFFLACASWGFLLFMMLRLSLGREEYNLYMAYGGEKTRRENIGVAIHFGKVLGLIFWVLTPLPLLVGIAYADTWSACTEHGLVENPFGSLGMVSERPYSDVKGVYKLAAIRYTERVEWRTHYQIRLKGGSKWPPRVMDFHYIALADAEYVANKAGLSIEEYRIEEDIPLYRKPVVTYETAAQRLSEISGAPLRDFSTIDFGRERNRKGKSVVVAPTKSREIVSQMRSQLGPGMVVFVGTTRWLGDEQPPDGEEIVLALGETQFDILRVAHSDAVNYDMPTEDLVKKLEEYDRHYGGIEIFHAETDTIEFRLKQIPQDLTAFCNDLYKFCPDIVDQGLGSVEELEKEIRQTQQVLLWWE